MKVEVQRSNFGLSLVLPQAVIETLKLSEGQQLDISIQCNQIVISGHSEETLESIKIGEALVERHKAVLAGLAKA